MLKRSKTITVICSIMIGVVFALAMLIIMTVAGVIRLGQNTLVIETESFEAKYDGTPLTNYTWKIADGKLKDGHTIEVNFTGSQTNVGESDNTVEVIIRDELGTDVTSDYKIQYNYGLLKVNPRTIAVCTKSATKAYDGIPLTSLEHEVSEDFDGLVRGHFIKAVVTGYQIEVGESANTMSQIEIFDFLGADVTANYRIVVREGTLMVYSPDGLGGGGSGASDNFGGGGTGAMDPDTVLYEVYAEKTANIYLREKSFGDYNGTGFDEAAAYEQLIAERFSAMYLSSFAMREGGLSEYELKIKALYDAYVVPYYLLANKSHIIQTSDVASEGDTSEEYTVSYYEAIETFQALPIQYKAYEVKYREYVYDNYTEVDPITKAFMYAISINEGLEGADVFATIERVAAYIQSSATYNLEYDTALDSEMNVAIAFLSTYKQGVCRHYAMAATLMFRTMGIPARYTVGILAEAVADEWTEVKASNAHAWVEVYVDGMGWIMVEVTGGGPGGGGSGGGAGGGGGSGGGGGGEGEGEEKPELELKPTTVSKKYDGTALFANNTVTGLDSLLAQGYTYEAVVTGSQTELGKSASRILKFTLYDPEHNDVTDDYAITYKQGVVHVYHSILKYKSYDDSKVYGEAVNSRVDFLSGSLMAGHTPVITMTAACNAGTSLNTYTVQIFDGETDVSDWYKFDRTYGTLVISRREITVKAADDTKTYDGTALTCNKIEYDKTQLASGDTITEYEVVGSQVSVGRSDNVVVVGSINITNEDGKDVTSNYEIILKAGKLRVTQT